MNRWVIIGIACLLLAATGWIWIIGYLFGVIWIFRRKLKPSQKRSLAK